MPIKSSLKTLGKFKSASTSVEGASTGENQTKSQETSTKSLTITVENAGGMKRDDSAYSSSTSSTVSEKPPAKTDETSTTDNKQPQTTASAPIDEIGESLDQMSLNSVTDFSQHPHYPHQQLRRSLKSSSASSAAAASSYNRNRNNSIRDSVGELNQLMLISSSSLTSSSAAVPDSDTQVWSKLHLLTVLLVIKITLWINITKIVH